MFSLDSNPTKLSENNENAVSRYTSGTCLSTNNVYLRIKPNSAKTNKEIYTVVGLKTLHVKKGENINKTFSFTRIFDSEYSQADLFCQSVRHQVISFLLGESSTILTYGASNSGKTYTLYGSTDSPGVIPRAIEFLFSTINCTLAPWYKISDDNRIVCLDEHERNSEIYNKTNLINPNVIAKEEYTQARLSLNNSNPRIPELEEQDLWSDECMSSVWMSVAEIYNNNVYDLLAIDDQERRPLKVTTRKDCSTYVNGLKFIHITTALEACQLLIFVRSRMAVISTAPNITNSQSHTILTLKLLKYEKENVPEEVRVSTLTFCDVAGSRKCKKGEGRDSGSTESRNINNSLLVLGRCLKFLRDSHPSNDNVTGPFRESKLTRILQKVLTGREKVSFIINIDIGIDSFPETLSALNFSAMAKKLGSEPGILKRNTFSMTTMTLKFPKSSTWTSATHSPRKVITVDFEEYETLKQQNKKLMEELSDIKAASNKKQIVSMKVSKEMQLENSFFDYRELQTKHAERMKRLEALKRENLNREFEIRQGLVDHYSTAIKQLESTWEKRTQDIEDERRYLLKWSVNQVETYFKERVDSIICNKKRKRDDDDNSNEIQPTYEELEVENAMITSEVVDLREMVRSLRTENELLNKDKDIYNFKFSLVNRRLKYVYELAEINFPELSFKVQNDASDPSRLMDELKRMFDEMADKIWYLKYDLNVASNNRVKITAKSMETEKMLWNTKIKLQETLNKVKDLESEKREKTNLIHNLQLQLRLLRKDLTDTRECEIEYDVKCAEKEDVRSLNRKYHSLSNEDFFCSDNSDNTELITQAHVDIKAERYFNDDTKNSLKNVSLNTVGSDLDRHTSKSNDSGNMKEDSGIDFSCRSQSINDSSTMEETKENYTQTASMFQHNNDECEQTKQLKTNHTNVEHYTEQEREMSLDRELSRDVSDLKSAIETLRRIADFNKVEVAEYRSKLLCCEEKAKELKEENEKLIKIVEIDSRKYNERINELTQELLVKKEDDNRSLKQLETCLKKCASLEDQLSMLHLVHEQTLKSFANTQIEKSGKELSAKSLETSDKVTETRSDLFRVQQLQEKVNGLETVLEKCQEERNNYRERLQEHLETQSMLEMKLKWLSTEIRSRDDELVSLKTEFNNMALQNESNDERMKHLSGEIVRSNDSVRCMKEKLTYFEETRKNLEERLENEIVDPRSNLTNIIQKIYEQNKDREEKFHKLKLQVRENETEMDLLKKHRNDNIKKYECMVQHLRIEVEKKKEQLTKLQKLIFTNFTLRYHKLCNKRRSKSMVFQLQKLTICSKQDLKVSSVDRITNDKELSPSIYECTIDNPRDVHFPNSQLSARNEEFDTKSAYGTEEFCPVRRS
ncbi:uncharacterized protein [Bombus fervidus]|uniref:uncharacterized protein n=1 Tax=Bombus fervidus TaxID=203811 RepID=UPI003AB66C6D